MLSKYSAIERLKFMLIRKQLNIYEYQTCYYLIISAIINEIYGCWLFVSICSLRSQKLSVALISYHRPKKVQNNRIIMTCDQFIVIIQHRMFERLKYCLVRCTIGHYARYITGSCVSLSMLSAAVGLCQDYLMFMWRSTGEYGAAAVSVTQRCFTCSTFLLVW